MDHRVIEIYTDGSCHAQYNIGVWGAILFIDAEKIIIKGEVPDTTHNRMELLAVIKAIGFSNEKYEHASIVIYTDSQYAYLIPERKEKLKRNLFVTKKGNPIQNSDLVKILINQIETHSITFIKVKAHQKSGSGETDGQINYNTEVDKLVRQMVRESVKRHY